MNCIITGQRFKGVRKSGVQGDKSGLKKYEERRGKKDKWKRWTIRTKGTCEESGSNKHRYPRGFGLGAIFWKSTGFLGRFQVTEIEINQFHNIY